MSTKDMQCHQWIISENDNKQTQQKFKLTLRELLSVSSDWKDVNKKNAGPGSYSTAGGSGSSNPAGLPIDFQS
jgi:hypothetical protein